MENKVTKVFIRVSNHEYHDIAERFMRNCEGTTDTTVDLETIETSYGKERYYLDHGTLFVIQTDRATAIKLANYQKVIICDFLLPIVIDRKLVGIVCSVTKFNSSSFHAPDSQYYVFMQKMEMK